MARCSSALARSIRANTGSFPSVSAMTVRPRALPAPTMGVRSPSCGKPHRPRLDACQPTGDAVERHCPRDDTVPVDEELQRRRVVEDAHPETLDADALAAHV